jgi:uncharacterized protein (DUF302 family)
MDVQPAENTYVMSERFDKALKTIRSALSEVELDVAEEFDVAGGFDRLAARTQAQSRILLVDCPLLLFEALAFDRASAVFLPLHILVSGDGDRTHISVINPAELFDARLPVGAADPMARLQARVALALESAILQCGANQH